MQQIWNTQSREGRRKLLLLPSHLPAAMPLCLPRKEIKRQEKQKEEEEKGSPGTLAVAGWKEEWRLRCAVRFMRRVKERTKRGQTCTACARRSLCDLAGGEERGRQMARPRIERRWVASTATDQIHGMGAGPATKKTGSRRKRIMPSCATAPSPPRRSTGAGLQSLDPPCPWTHKRSPSGEATPSSKP